MNNQATAEYIIPRLRGVKKTRNGWLALCPAHDDYSPSLSIGQAQNGRIWIICLAGCTREALDKALLGVGIDIKAINGSCERASVPVLGADDLVAELRGRACPGGKCDI